MGLIMGLDLFDYLFGQVSLKNAPLLFATGQSRQGDPTGDSQNRHPISLRFFTCLFENYAALPDSLVALFTAGRLVRDGHLKKALFRAGMRNLLEKPLIKLLNFCVQEIK